MGIIKRQSLKTSIVNYLGVFLGVIFFVFVFPHIISDEYLGLIGLFQNLSITLVALPSLGMAHILLRYYSSWNDEKMLKSFNTFSVMMVGIALITFSAIWFLFKSPIVHFYESHSSLFLKYFVLMIPLVIIQTYSSYFEIFSMVKLRITVPAFLREIGSRIILIFLVFLFAYQHLNEEQFFNLFVFSYLLTALILIIYCVRILNFEFGSIKIYVQSKEFKSSMRYGFGMLLLISFTNFSNFIDSIILPAYLGLDILGIYLRPLVLGQMIQVPYRAISLISIPILREAFVQKDYAKIQKMNKGLALNLFLIGCFLFSLLIGNTENIFQLFPPQYTAAKDVLLIIATGRLIDMAFGLNSEILNYSPYYRSIIYFSLLMMALSIVLNIILIPKFGMNGAAIAVAISLIIFNFLKTLYIYKKLNIHCFSKHYITLILITLFVLVIAYFIPSIQFISNHRFINTLINIIFKSSILATLFIGLTYFLKVSIDLNDFVKLVLSGKILKGGHRLEEL
ncbi:MAG TPA: polysaccharide biosynthesis C-terminal domain-containing protein [Chitinophagaceae bacterium]|nr:polysaccharide biosynthesis C-terminal domain-containing protein [Chitinophagaceae bacterium]